MKIVDPHKKVKAAGRLLTQDKIDYKTFKELKTLLKGISPKADKALAECDKHYSKLKKYQKGDVIQLTVENLPEETDKDKKRKKALLLFLKYYKQLMAEVNRLHTEYHKDKPQNLSEKIETSGRILSRVKGPFGLVTLGAVVIVGGIILYNKSVSKQFSNTGQMQRVDPPSLIINQDGSSETIVNNDSRPSYWIEEITADINGNQMIIGAHVHIQDDESRANNIHIPASGAVVTLDVTNQEGSTQLTGSISSEDGWHYWTEPAPQSETTISVVSISGDLPWAQGNQAGSENFTLTISP